MATPAMILQNAFAAVNSQGKATLRINTFNLDGSALDVHTGYTVEAAVARPSQGANPLVSSVDISSAIAAAFDTTGVTLTFNGATLAPLLSSLANAMQIDLSNDAGSTQQPAATGTLQLNIVPADA